MKSPYAFRSLGECVETFFCSIKGPIYDMKSGLYLISGILASLWISTIGQWSNVGGYGYNAANAPAISRPNAGGYGYNAAGAQAISGSNVGGYGYNAANAPAAVRGSNVGYNGYGYNVPKAPVAMTGSNVGYNGYGYNVPNAPVAMTGSNVGGYGYNAANARVPMAGGYGLNGHAINGYHTGHSEFTGRSMSGSNIRNDVYLGRSMSGSKLGTNGGQTNSLNELQCGVKDPMEVSGRILGGKLVKYGEFPFIVSIRMGSKANNQHHCGGAVIHKSWVLTAAHCFVGISPKQFIVRVGEHNLDDKNEHQMDHLVAKIVFHTQLYKPKKFNNDIAMLKLKTPVIYNDYVAPTCLPRATDDFTGLMGTVMGWGALMEKSDDPSSQLKKVKVRIMNTTECQAMYNQSSKKLTFYPGQICAGYREGERDACQGDSGGPLTLEFDGRYIVVGIVSAGIGCGRALLPGVYTEVAAKLDWIHDVLETV